MKLPGYGTRVAERLAAAGLLDRTLVSCMFRQELDTIRIEEPRLRLGWSVPRVRRDYTTDLLTAIPALALLSGYRVLLPGRAQAALRRGRSRRSWPTGGSSRRPWWTRSRGPVVSCSSGPSMTRGMIERLRALGVDGIISNDPRLMRQGSERPAKAWPERGAAR